MDPFSAVGIIASIVQIADASFKIMKILDTMKDGAKERRALSDEITVLWMLLRNLEIQFMPLSEEKNGSWSKPLESLAQAGGIFDQLSTALEEVFNKLTQRESGFGRAMQTVRWPLTQTYVDKIIAKVERLKSSIILVSEQANIALTQEMRGDVSAIKEIVDHGHFKEVMDWLSPLNFRQKQENNTASGGTGAWFFQRDEFKKWLAGDDRWFWCYGIPGAGKTFLASATVKELRRIHRSDRALVLIMFCSFDSAQSQSVENLIASLLKQIAQTQMFLPEGSEKLFKKHRVSDTRPKMNELQDLLNDVLAKSPRAFIVLDALDELSDDTKKTMLLDALLGLKSKPKIMLTSRKIESIANRFGWPLDESDCDGCNKRHLEVYTHCEDCRYDYCKDCAAQDQCIGHACTSRFSSVKLRIVAHPEDIEYYVNGRTDSEDELRRLVQRQPDLRFQILKKIVEKAQDMFLLATFHVNALANCDTLKELRHTLANLPDEIDETYNKAMERIKTLPKGRQRKVIRLLMWVSFAQRPLSIQEFEHATAIEGGAREISLDAVMDAKILTSLSAGLVIVDENEDMRLTHKTAETYFTEKRSILFPEGDIEIAESCLDYLQLSAFDSGPCVGPNASDAFDARLVSCPFVAYAALYWGHHVRLSQSKKIVPQALRFLRNKNALATCIQTMWHLDIESHDSWDVPDGVDALHLASYFGLSEIVEGLLSGGADPNSQDPLGTTALIYASSNGHVDVADILLRAGADPSLVDERGSTALHRAVRSEQFEMTRLLLGKSDIGINKFYTAWKSLSPLLMAVLHGNSKLVEILLRHLEIDVNLASPTTLRNPLLLASETDEPGVLNLLLQHPRIDKNFADAECITALHYAANAGNISCLKLLLQNGCNADFHHPIHQAIDYDEMESVVTLIQHGVETGFTDGFGRTILHAGAVNNRADILRFLLETGIEADINHRGSNGETPLHDAVRGNFIDTVRVLIEYGARMDITNAAERSPVRVAIDAGHSEIVELLREARAKEQNIENSAVEGGFIRADTFESKDEQPLPMLIQRGSTKFIRLRLINMSVDDINAPSPDNLGRDTALHFACRYRRLDIVKLLLKAGADPNQPDHFRRTALTISCQEGDLAAVNALTRHGADVNFREFGNWSPWEVALANGGNEASIFLISLPQTVLDASIDQLAKALGWAAALGNVTACKRLVDVGAPAYLKNSVGISPPQIAKGWDHKDLERFLMKAASQQVQRSSRKLPVLVSDVIAHQEVGDVDFYPPAQSPTSKKEFGDILNATQKSQR